MENTTQNGLSDFYLGSWRARLGLRFSEPGWAQGDARKRKTLHKTASQSSTSAPGGRRLGFGFLGLSGGRGWAGMRQGYLGFWRLLRLLAGKSAEVFGVCFSGPGWGGVVDRTVAPKGAPVFYLGAWRCSTHR